MSFLSNENKAMAEFFELKAAISKLYFDTMGCEAQENEPSIDLLKKSFNFLNDIIREMPGHVYWLDRNNVYLGCNEIQARDVGLSSPEEIKGKKT